MTSYPSPDVMLAEFVARTFYRRCLSNPDLDDHPAPVLTNELANILDELHAKPEAMVTKPTLVVNGKARCR